MALPSAICQLPESGQGEGERKGKRKGKGEGEREREREGDILFLSCLVLRPPARPDCWAVPQPQPGTAQPSRATASGPAARTRIFSSRGHVTFG